MERAVIADVNPRSRENNSAHRTRDIDRDRLIVRRGQPFSISLQRSDPLPPRHHLDLVLHLGKNDEVVIKLQRERNATTAATAATAATTATAAVWWFNQQEAQDEILLTVFSPADAIVGSYRLVVLLVSPDGGIVERTSPVGFHLLFNPWCKDDAVYLPDERLLQEYVMNEDGLIYLGSSDDIDSIPWNFLLSSQFEDNVMDICFQVLDYAKDALRDSKMAVENRRDPVYVGRTITAMVNANGDRGVLAGRWTEPYSDGVAPYRWTGSVQILRQWRDAGAEAVKYGQCWVFAGVACTVLRCLGIPTRLITNFSSAHDVDGNLSLDVELDETLRSGPKDSSWNFHCWVESWMKREDLPDGNDGWQVLDPTPQELSEGEFCCGPCPVAAIKEGNVGVKYDAPFVFAEVNADITYWRTRPDGQRQRIRVDDSSVGKNISTKSAYGEFREDVTLLYKYPEGSREEREAYERAKRRVSDPSAVDGVEPSQLQLSIKHAAPVFGTDFDVIVEVNNKGNKDADAQLTILAMAATYNSIYRGECQRRMTTVTVPAHKVHKEVLRLRYDDYVKCVSEHHMITVRAFLDTTGENEPAMTMATIRLSTPKLQIQVTGKAVVQQQTTVRVSFTNPLPVPLKDGVFTVEGAGLLAASQIYVKGDISPGEKVVAKLSFSPMRAGVRRLMVDFDSDRLRDVKGVTTVVVHKRFRYNGFA